MIKGEAEEIVISTNEKAKPKFFIIHISAYSLTIKKKGLFF